MHRLAVFERASTKWQVAERPSEAYDLAVARCFCTSETAFAFAQVWSGSEVILCDWSQLSMMPSSVPLHLRVLTLTLSVAAQRHLPCPTERESSRAPTPVAKGSRTWQVGAGLRLKRIRQATARSRWFQPSFHALAIHSTTVHSLSRTHLPVRNEDELA